jgi:broad specificity phosphatase PhoE
MTTKIFFVRHGEVNNPKNVCYGRLPGYPLSELGKKQAAQTAQELIGCDVAAIYSSPILRTKQTAQIIGKVLHLPVNYSDSLLEVKTSMQGKNFDYILSKFPDVNLFASKANDISGDTIEDVSQRMQRFIRKIIKNYKGKNIVAVTHGDPIMLAKTQVEGLPIIINSIRPKNKYIGLGKIYLAELNTR